MRKSPINYIVTIAVIAVLWIVAAVLAGNYLSDNAALTNTTTEDFDRVYRIVMTIGAIAAVAGLAHWYWHGAKDATATDLPGARRFWSLWFFILLIASVGCVASMVLAFLGEHFTTIEYLTMFGCASLLTWIPYWIFSLAMSPRGVKRAPLGMR